MAQMFTTLGNWNWLILGFVLMFAGLALVIQPRT